MHIMMVLFLSILIIIVPYVAIMRDSEKVNDDILSAYKFDQASEDVMKDLYRGKNKKSLFKNTHNQVDRLYDQTMMHLILTRSRDVKYISAGSVCKLKWIKGICGWRARKPLFFDREDPKQLTVLNGLRRLNEEKCLKKSLKVRMAAHSITDKIFDGPVQDTDECRNEIERIKNIMKIGLERSNKIDLRAHRDSHYWDFSNVAKAIRAGREPKNEYDFFMKTATQYLRIEDIMDMMPEDSFSNFASLAPQRHDNSHLRAEDTNAIELDLADLGLVDVPSTPERL